MISSIVNFDWCSKSITFSNNGSHLQFEIKSLALAPLSTLSILGNLSLWPGDWGAINDNTGGSSVISNWKMSPVWLQSVVHSSEHHSDVVSMVFR